MDALQHVYRRGHIFWWRRIHRLFNGVVLDVRLSLRTMNRLEARNRGAMLTALTCWVVHSLDERMQDQETEPTEAELQTIAKAMYEARLVELCTAQRSEPAFAEYHSAANLAFADYFQRMIGLGGRMSLLPAEEQRLEAEGWDAQRIADLREIILQEEEKGISAIRRDEVDRHLRRAGFIPTDRLRWMLELLLYPAYRDAHIEAEVQLQAMVGFPDIASVADEVPAGPLPSQPSPEASSSTAIPADWIHCTPRQAAERMIADTPRLLEHRAKGKRAREAVGEQTHRQIRWAAALLEKSLPPGTPLWKVTHADIIALDEWFDRLPITFGKSDRDREPLVTLELAAQQAADKIAEGDLQPDDVGLSTGTTNKHFNKLGQIHKFMLKKLRGVNGIEAIDFSEFTAPIDKDEREGRTRYTREQGRAIFGLPPWVGCAGIDDRLTQGPEIVHDGLFFLLLLVWYTGARREELCKLMLDDVEERHGTAYLLIRPTAAGRLKNKSARRVVVIAEGLSGISCVGGHNG